MRKIDGNKLHYDENQTARLDGVLFSGLAYYIRSDGSKESEVDYIDGVQCGYVRDFSPSGNIVLEAKVENNAYHGVVKYFLDDGSVTKREVYEFGICLSREKLDANGVLINVFQLKITDPKFKILESMRAAMK